MVARFRSIPLIFHRLTVCLINLKSADLYRSWGFKSPSGHHRIKYLQEIDLGRVSPFRDRTILRELLSLYDAG